MLIPKLKAKWWVIPDPPRTGFRRQQSGLCWEPLKAWISIASQRVRFEDEYPHAVCNKLGSMRMGSGNIPGNEDGVF